jgi:hypothetical protein
MRVRAFFFKLGKVFLASREELKWLTRPRKAKQDKASKASKETKHVQGSGEYLKILLKLLYIHTCICIGKLRIIKSKQISCKKIEYKLIMYSHAAFPLPSGLWPNFSPRHSTHGRTTTLRVRDISTSPAGACSGTHFLSCFFPSGGGGEEDSLHQ